MQEMQAMDAAEQRRFMELAHPRALRAAQRAFKRWPRRKREDAIAEMVGKVWMTWVLTMERGKDSVALLGPNIHFAMLRVRHHRKNAGGARGFDMFDDRANRERHPFLIIGGESRAARFGPTTPKQFLRRIRRALTWQFMYIPIEPWRWGRLKWMSRLPAPWSETLPEEQRRLNRSPPPRRRGLLVSVH